ncbi:hypothetical protein D3C85_1538670 [compost metagenome]
MIHPIGATMGDYLTKPEGLNLGNIDASLLIVVVFIIVITTGQLTKTDDLIKNTQLK